MELSRSDTPLGSFYKVLISTIIPRPIGWISTIDEAGVPNLAPFSFFNLVTSRPPTVLFSAGVRGSDGSTKDTYNNVLATGEFVVNLVTEELAEAMNHTATELPPEIDEFEYAGLTATPSVAVAPPRVGESPVNMECKLSQVVDVGDGRPGSSWVIFGEVVHIHAADRVMLPNYRINLDELRPIGRLSGSNYARTRDRFELIREPSKVGPKKP